mmetsp:Transcript_40111/g.89899  ORF Transcript_40111/g.89899 Transcript_40111/m.89899 type:complete len:308 (-) Transcript_40111:59-982(-)
MEDFDLVGEPSTAQVLMGARSRGAVRDPRAVAIELDDFDFDPNFDPNLPSGGAGSSVPSKPPQTVTAAPSGASGADVVDPEELKRRIRGAGPSGSGSKLWERCLERTRELLVGFGDCARQQASERPKVAFGLFLALLLLAMFAGIWLTARAPAVSADVEAFSISGPTTTTMAGEVVVEELSQPERVADREEPDKVVIEPREKVKREAKVTGKDPAQDMFATLRQENKLLRQDIAALRSEVLEVKGLLRGSPGSEPRREPVAPTTEAPGELPKRKKFAEAADAPVTVPPIVDAEGDNDPGEIHIETPR